jgi:hypothetical protein
MQVGVIRNVEVEVEAALEKLKARRREEQKKIKEVTKNLEQDLQQLAKYTGMWWLFLCKAGPMMLKARHLQVKHWCHIQANMCRMQPTLFSLLQQPYGRIFDVVDLYLPWHVCLPCLHIKGY